MSDQETQVLQPESSPEVSDEEKKRADKKTKNLEQLKLAREKATEKKRLKQIEAENTKRKLAELEARLKAVAKVEADQDTEDEPEPKKQIVTRQPEQQPEQGPSLLNEIKKTILLSGLGIASFLVAQRYNKPTPSVTPQTPTPTKRPAPSAQDGFIVPPPKKRQVDVFQMPQPKNPVGQSGFFV